MKTVVIGGSGLIGWSGSRGIETLELEMREVTV
jgi:hypothetical protein